MRAGSYAQRLGLRWQRNGTGDCVRAQPRRGEGRFGARGRFPRFQAIAGRHDRRVPPLGPGRLARGTKSVIRSSSFEVPCTGAKNEVRRAALTPSVTCAAMSTVHFPLNAPISFIRLTPTINDLANCVRGKSGARETTRNGRSAAASSAARPLPHSLLVQACSSGRRRTIPMPPVVLGGVRTPRRHVDSVRGGTHVGYGGEGIAM